MRILIVNRWTDAFASYGRDIDHRMHQVAYVTVDGWQVPEGARHAVVLPDMNDADAVVEAARECARHLGGVDRVLAFSESDLLTGGRIRDLLDVPGARPQTLTKFRDKPVMKEAVAAAGLAVPAFQIVHSAEELAAFARAARGDVIVKPRAGMGSQGTQVIGRGLDIVGSFDDLQVEEFVSGPIWHVDGVVREGAVPFARASAYIGTCYDFHRGQPLGSLTREGAAAEEMTRFTELCLKSLDLTDGLFHLEAIQTPDGPVFLEIGARVGGGPTPELFLDAYGVDLVKEWITIELGEPSTLPGEYGGHVGYLELPGIPGAEVAEVTSLLGRIPHLYFERLAAPGHVFTGSPDTDIAATYHFRADSPDQVQEAIESSLAVAGVSLR